MAIRERTVRERMVPEKAASGVNMLKMAASEALTHGRTASGAKDCRTIASGAECVRPVFKIK